MANIAMANINILFRKGYLLAGVIMAANMFIVNDVKAMIPENEKKEEEDGKKKQKNFFTHDSSKDTTIKILFRENYVNFFGTLALSGFNNYLKWWDYNPGTYCKFVWVGWRSKKLLNDIFQFEVNLNVIKGVLWLIPGSLFFFVQKGYFIYKRNTACSITISLLFFHIINNVTENVEKEKKHHIKVMASLLSILQGFVSAPLTFHLSKFNFSISISLDAILWELVGIWARKKVDRIYENMAKEAGKPIKKENEEND